ncbi:transcriptional regulator [Streptomyces cinnamoneus]|uniref:Transcriptional regulator n=1 Tax=Streptomyces cinnamoneus TaxID=53446 RepID=A0A2G1XIJ6_STRCJ|nr:helix-turn-helix transcriptional regulator [Streptomyces cinnamoneus]PHQ50959.1 transcriptional regulator [Streptomyces cinnamoneus]PPT13819.1 XRE family transcriptional regulator [Streptomyces cinnamoneus]
MPPRENPTARQVRLGTELRKLRERAGKTAREAAARVSTDQAKISHIEAGRVGVSEERVRRLATFYSCSDEALIEALCAITREHRGQHWWDEYRGVLSPGFLDISELEHHATALRSMQTVTIPGLLQTEAYARALFGSGIPELPTEELEARLAHRMRRQLLLEGEDPPAFSAIIHEAALRMRFGGASTARAQLKCLMAACERPRVTVRVVPFNSERFIEAATQPVLYAVGCVPQLDTVQIDSALGGSFLDSEADLERYRALFTAAERAALSPEESLKFIHHVASES